LPGGIGTRQLIHDDVIRAWLQSVHPNTTLTTSVCTGALLLAAAGLLDGLTATTNWRAADLLNELGAHYVPERVVEHLPQRIITAAGVSSGIDMALRLVELLVDRRAAQALSCSSNTTHSRPSTRVGSPRPTRPRWLGLTNTCKPGSNGAALPGFFGPAQFPVT
jgi:transcriptional regulator GlxA family with amidase domain